MSTAARPPAFDEPRWEREQREHEAELFRLMTSWLEQQHALGPALRARLSRRVVRDGGSGRTDCPSLYAMRLADALGVRGRPREALAIATTLFWAAADVADDLDDGEPLAPEDGITANDACGLLFLAQRALLDVSPACARLGCDYGLKMASGQALDLSSTDRPVPPELDALVRGKAGAELAFFFHLATLAAGVESPALIALGEAFGCALQVFSDVADLYLKPVSPDFVTGKWTWPLFYFRQSGDEARQLESFPRHWTDVLMRVRYQAAEGSQRALERFSEGLLMAWERARPALPASGPIEDAVAWLLASMRAVREALDDLGEPPPLPARVEPDDALARAAAFLRAQPEVGEDHRWGMFGRDFVSGNLYPLFMKAAALREAGLGWEADFERLLALKDADGWRYYPGHPEIPTDADDTGLVLGYFAEWLPAEVREAACDQLLAHFEGDTVHTWMGPPPKEIAWEGDDCLATLANACWGLCRNERGPSVPPAAWRRLLEAAAADKCESPFYPPALTRMFLHRALAEAASRGIVFPADALRARRRLEEHLARAERLAGNFGPSVQDTAVTVLAASAWGLPLRRAALETWLCERQEPDGCWPSEPFSRVPGVHHRPRVWGSAATTTSWVMLALLALRRQ